jgi:hypothetical protein
MCFQIICWLQRYAKAAVRLCIILSKDNTKTPAVLQKAANWKAKGRLLPSKRPPFTMQKAAFCKTVDFQPFANLFQAMCPNVAKKYYIRIRTV